jgi:two-component system, OmpR family, phosphate regulon sensor histidine kinase PhoR
MSSRWYIKIVSAFILVILVVVIPAAIYLESTLNQFLMSQKEDELRRELRLAAQMVAGRLDDRTGRPTRIPQLVKQVEEDLQKRVTVISPDGKVLGDSALSSDAVDRLDDHSHRPEILGAKTSGYGQTIRFSTTMQSNTLYGATPFYREGRVAGYVRLAVPLSRIEQLVADLRWKLILAGGLTTVLALLLSFFLTWSINRPLREITDMVKKMAEGDLKQPFHLLPKSEFSDLALSLERMANELKEKIGLLDAETSQLTTLLANMSEGVLVTDEKGRIILMNSFLQEILGEKVIWKKRSVQEVFMNSDLQDAVEMVLQGESFKKLQITHGRSPQKHFDVQVVALNPVQRPRRSVALFHDTTELQYLLKVRQDFVANASHELRTPLTSISGYVETLQTLVPNEPPEIQRFLTVIQKNVARMTLLVSELLDLAQLGARENLAARAKTVPVREILETALQMVADQAKEKNITVLPEMESLPDGLTGNWEKDRIIQAVFNVLDNGVKYTPHGGQVRLSARLVQSPGPETNQPKGGAQPLRAEGADFLEVSIADTGPGISREHLPRIFERFYRVDKARSRDLGGTGLGLSIVKNIVEAHGGTVQVMSTLNQGSTFSLILPLAGPNQRPAPS